MKLGYFTTFKLGDKVKPVTNDEDYPIMTVCAIQLGQMGSNIKELYQVDWFKDGAFMDKWVECHQIAKV